MNPDKLLRLLGYNNLSIILMQERRHWLMKTDKNKQIQDKITGDIFQGRLDNTGSDVVIESKKLPYRYDYTSEIKFNLAPANEVMDITLSALPYSATVNGLMYTRITSISYQYDLEQYSNYKIRFTNAEEVIIPFSASSSSKEVYAGKWLRTTTPPTMLLYDPTSQSHTYSITRILNFSSNVTNPVWYYPLEESLQPFEIESHTGTTYELVAIDDDRYIGNPLFWFTCDQSNIGSTMSILNNTGTNNTQIMYIANEGPSAPYGAKIYIGLDGNDDATPDGSSINNYEVFITAATSGTFADDTADFDNPISKEIIFKNTSTNQTYTLTLDCSESDRVFMSNDSENWIYVDSSTYKIPMSYFEINSLRNHGDSPLVALLRVVFDPSVPFVQSTPDYGYAGMRFYAGNPDTDTIDRYPYNLNKLEGLPTWIREATGDAVQEHGIVYAVHNNSNTDPEDPSTSQLAGLILDPGLTPDPEAESNPDSVGRVYILSNDPITYENNSTSENPKPARTAARICDIPTSAVELIGANGLIPTQVVDKRYVRTETSYSVSDKSALYNLLPTKWVKPMDYGYAFMPVYEEYGSDNKYVFESYDELMMVDMMSTHNKFRTTINLNPQIPIEDISIGLIADAGSGYTTQSLGLCIVGGCSFTYHVSEVGDNGEVRELSIAPPSGVTSIPLMNFNFENNEPFGYTLDYGTSPVTGGGDGKLRFSFRLMDLDQILPTPSEFFTDLFALVRENTGLYLYTYEIDSSSAETPKPGTWTRGEKISNFEVSTTNKFEGGIATSESFINSIIPKLEILPITRKENNGDLTSIKVMQTANCISVIDTDHSPVVPSLVSEHVPENIVDFCKFYCDGIVRANAVTRSTNAVITYLSQMNKLRFDSYVIWRWTGEGMTTEFEYGIVYRGFSNTFTTDSTTKLPVNELKCDNYVHFNAGTTIVWNVPGVGPMVWAYDPTYTKYEDYRIDQETMDLHVVRNEITYADIDVRRSGSEEVIKIVDDDGNYLWNVLSNNPQNVNYSPSSTDPLYIDPPMTAMTSVVIGANKNDTPDEQKMKGNWTLVFPRISSYTLSNDVTHTQYIPKKLECIKGRDILVTDNTRVFDENENDVSMKAVIISENDDETTMKVFNSTEHRWENV